MDEETLDEICKLQQQIEQQQTELKELYKQTLKLAEWVLKAHVESASHLQAIYGALQKHKIVEQDKIKDEQQMEMQKIAAMVRDMWNAEVTNEK